MIELTDEILNTVIKKRLKDSHKGTFGRLLVVGGNSQYGGAAILAASAAVYSGAGLVTVATDAVNHAALHARLPEAMVIDWTEAFETEKYTVIVIGCGLGLQRRDLLTQVLKNQTENQWLVIDGSALTIFAEQNIPVKFPEHVIFTPHQMEMQRISGLKIDQQTVPAVQAFTDKLGAIVVAKSSETKIFSPNREAYILKIGSPAQATGGMGDTLAGMIGGFLAQFRSDTTEVAAAATYLHSRIAHKLADEQYVVLPSQIISEIPVAMKKFEE
ncbi:NAD(P)H-hydrate dehydratase [Lactovum odontotermitis]